MRGVRSSGLWRAVGIAALASTLLLVFGFGYAVKDMLWPQAQSYSGKPAADGLPAQSALAAAKEINVAAIGDSLTKGTGDSSGEGYVKQTVALLQKKYSVPVKLVNNLGVNGMRADQLADELANNKGVRHALMQANVILFTIGGNDLFQLATGQTASEATGQVDLSKLKRQLPVAVERFKLVAGRLHQLNPNAYIVYVGMYNPFYDLKGMREGSLYVQQWNEQAYAALANYPNTLMVPTFDLFERSIKRNISSDHFHPNHEGYAAIASRIAAALQ